MRGLPHQPLPGLARVPGGLPRGGPAHQPGGAGRRHRDQHRQPRRRRAASAYLAKVAQELGPAGGRPDRHRRRRRSSTALPAGHVTAGISPSPSSASRSRAASPSRAARAPRPMSSSSTISRGRRHAAAASACPIRATARASSRRWSATLEAVRGLIEAGGDAGRRSQAAAGGGRAQRRSTAPCGTSRPSYRAGRSGSWPGSTAPQPLTTAYTISLGTPENMAEAAARAADRPLLKLKLGGEGDVERVRGGPRRGARTRG